MENKMAELMLAKPVVQLTDFHHARTHKFSNRSLTVFIGPKWSSQCTFFFHKLQCVHVCMYGRENVENEYVCV